MAAGDLSRVLNSQGKSEDLAFASSAGLQNGFYMLDPYVAPALGALTPGVWGFAAPRGHGPIVYSFGRPVAGGSKFAPDLLRTLPTQSSTHEVEFSDINPKAIPSAMSWWVDALNAAFSVISDPAVFADSSGDYQPSAHLEALLTVEQLFRRVLAIQVNYHDLNARRVLLFTVLDTIQSLTGRPLEKNCELSFAEKVLRRLEAALPGDGGEVLLPRARRAVAALRAVQDGFFLRDADGRIPVEGRRESLSPDRAAALYLKVLRDATHGHGGVKSGQIRVTRAMLARHTGEVPSDVALLGWLYLLDVLQQPHVLRARLSSASRKRDP